MINRRQFLQIGFAAGVASLVTIRSQVLRGAMAAPAGAVPVVLQTPLPGSALPQFVDPLPTLGDLTPIVDNGSEIQLSMEEFITRPLPSTTVLPNGVPYAGTYVWGYLTPEQAAAKSKATYLGPVVVATRGAATKMRFTNNLGNTVDTRVLAYSQSTDQTLHWADPLNNEANAANMMVRPMMAPEPPYNEHYDGPIAAAVHLHGGEVPPNLDGGPDAWFTSDGQYHGHGFYSYEDAENPAAGNQLIMRYPNTQEASPIWFHDHTLGATRLNVYAGLAGGYIIVDPQNPPPGDLADPTKIIPVIIQDRMFDTSGQLYFPAGVPFTPNPEHPFWVPEFVGDTILVNGKVWPYMDVEPARYRFLFLNGSNARAYELFLTDPVTKLMGPPMYQIGTDGGYLDAAVKIDPNAPKGALQRLVIMPGERAEIVIDFSKLAVGTTLIIKNVAKTPYPNGAAPNGSTTGKIMQFRVVASAPGAPKLDYDPVKTPKLRPSNPLVRLVNAGTTVPGVAVDLKRTLTLNEVMAMPSTVGGIAYPGGPLEVLVNNTKWSGESFRPYLNEFTEFSGVNGPNTIVTKVSETPEEGATELWEIVNLTADAHPMHLHLVQFQVISRQAFDVAKYNVVYNGSFPGGSDPKTGAFFLPKTLIPAFGPPLAYNVPNADGALGGNPAVKPFLKGAVKLPPQNEAGWKDTIQAYPGEVTRILVRFAPTDTLLGTPKAQAAYPFDPSNGTGYVWHCHIIDHEDNEMMRPLAVTANPNAARSVTDY